MARPAAAKDNPAYPSSEHLNELLKVLWNALDRQDNEIKSLRDRASTLIGAGLVVLGLVFTAASRLPVAGQTGWAIVVASGLIGLSLIAGVAASIVRKVHYPAKAPELLKLYYRRPTNEMLARLASTVADAYEKNERPRIIPIRAWAVVVQFCLTVAGAAALTVAIILYELSVGQTQPQTSATHPPATSPTVASPVRPSHP